MPHPSPLQYHLVPRFAVDAPFAPYISQGEKSSTHRPRGTRLTCRSAGGWIASESSWQLAKAGTEELALQATELLVPSQLIPKSPVITFPAVMILSALTGRSMGRLRQHRRGSRQPLARPLAEFHPL